MDVNSKRELADALINAARAREASWADGRYVMTWAEAADQAVADADLRPLVVAMLASGYGEFSDWATRHGSIDALVAGNAEMLRRPRRAISVGEGNPE
jgi:hypothetical protein